MRGRDNKKTMFQSEFHHIENMFECFTELPYKLSIQIRGGIEDFKVLGNF